MKKPRTAVIFDSQLAQRAIVRLGKSREWVAVKARVSHATVNRALLGKGVTPVVAHAIARALGTTVRGLTGEKLATPSAIVV